MKQINKVKGQNTHHGQNVVPLHPKRTKALLSLKQRRTLLSYLTEENELTEQEARTLKKYRQLHFKSKRDMGGLAKSGVR